MARTHIDVRSTASRHSALVRQTVDAARLLQQRVQQVKDVMDQVASGGDWDALGTELGTSAADAEIVYNLWTAVIPVVVSDSDFNALIDRVG